MEEPLVRFAAIGALVFAIDHALRPSERRIEITPEFAEAMARRELERAGETPSEARVEAAIARFVREEALYREAIELGLDAGDLIVRRRLVQKMELWLDARTEEIDPSERELAAWYSANEASLREPPRTSLELVLCRGDGSEERAALEAGAEPAGVGVPSPHGRRLALRTDAQIDALLGDGVAAHVTPLDIGAWSPPIGGRGIWIVRPTQRVPGRSRSLDEVRERARREVIDERRERAREDAIEEIVARWTVVRSDRAR